MVTNVTSLTGNGLKDWLIQRATAVFLAGYTIFLLYFFLSHSPMEMSVWHELWSCHAFQIASVITIVSVSLHAWIGIWTVTTDYIKCTILRLSLQLLVLAWLLAQLIWAVMIIWGQ